MFELLLGCHLCQAGTLKVMQLAALESPTMLFSVVILIESRIALEIGLWTCPWGTVLIAIEEGRSKIYPLYALPSSGREPGLCERRGGEQ